MAIYKYANFLVSDAGGQFDVIHEPGQSTPISGVYRCTGCGKSVTSVKDKPLPSQNHHQHNNGTRIRWQLTVQSHWV